MKPGLSDEEARELLGLLEEAALGDWERRRRRMRASEERLAKVGKDLGEALKKARLGGPLSEDEFIVTHGGFTPQEWASGEPNREIKRREARKCNVQDKETSS